MYVILVIGGARQGKTPFIKNYCSGNNTIIFDVQNEYGERTKYPGQIPYGLPTDIKQDRSRVIDLDVDKFIQVCNNKRNTICVFEEATMFFQGITLKPMRKLVFSKAHTHNVYMLVFHSINSVPPRLMESADWVILFKTNDEEKTVERKYRKLLPAFQQLQKAKDGTHLKIKTI